MVQVTAATPSPIYLLGAPSHLVPIRQSSVSFLPLTSPSTSFCKRRKIYRTCRETRTVLPYPSVHQNQTELFKASLCTRHYSPQNQPFGASLHLNPHFSQSSPSLSKPHRVRAASVLLNSLPASLNSFHAVLEFWNLHFLVLPPPVSFLPFDS